MTRTGPAPRWLRSSLVVPVIVVSALAMVAVGIAGGPVGRGLALGGLVAFAVMALGSVLMTTTSTVMPAASMAVGLLTYTLQVLVLAAFLAAAQRTDMFGRSADERGIAGGLVVVTVGWLTWQIRTAVASTSRAAARPAGAGPALDRAECGVGADGC
ncbi:MAG: hypothetical protein ACRCYU_13720 [Nocardioides sp.]